MLRDLETRWSFSDVPRFPKTRGHVKREKPSDPISNPRQVLLASRMSGAISVYSSDQRRIIRTQRANFRGAAYSHRMFRVATLALGRSGSLGSALRAAGESERDRSDALDRSFSRLDRACALTRALPERFFTQLGSSSAPRTWDSTARRLFNCTGPSVQFAAVRLLPRRDGCTLLAAQDRLNSIMPSKRAGNCQLHRQSRAHYRVPARSLGFECRCLEAENSRVSLGSAFSHRNAVYAWRQIVHSRSETVRSVGCCTN